MALPEEAFMVVQDGDLISLGDKTVADGLKPLPQNNRKNGFC